MAADGWDDSCQLSLAVVGAYIKFVFETAVPKAVSIHTNTVPVLLFTDGAWEADSAVPAGAGIVLIDPSAGVRKVYEVLVPPELVVHWKSLGKAQLIAELELLPLLVAFAELGSFLQGRRVLCFVDNNAVRDVIAKATSRTLSIFVLVTELYRLWEGLQSLCWVSRVPTKSNIADWPSRQEPQQAADMIGGVVEKALKPSEELCQL